MVSKTCTKCLVSKDVLLFCKSPKTRDRLTSWCKGCCAAANKTKYRAERGLSDDKVAQSRAASISRARNSLVSKGHAPVGFYTCKKCEIPKPLLDFKGHKGRICTTCVEARQARSAESAKRRLTARLLAGKNERAAERSLRPPPPLYVPPLAKPCSHCRGVKPLMEFGPGGCRDGRDSWCRPCVSAASGDYRKHRRATDPVYRETLAAQKRLARRTADPELARRDADRAVQAALQADHKAHVATYHHHRSRCHSHVDAWKAHQAATAPAPKPSNPTQTIYERAKSAYRRARRLGRLAPWCRIRDTLPFYALAAAHEQATGVDWHVDHYIPLRADLASGLHCPANLTILPRADNQAKSNFFSLDHQ